MKITEEEAEFIRLCRAHPERVAPAVHYMRRVIDGMPEDQAKRLFAEEVAEGCAP